MQDQISCQIESIALDELLHYMRFQADEAFPSLKDEVWLQTFTNKLHSNAKFCLCRDNNEPIGMIAFYANGQGADFAYIPHVYVSPDYRQKGLFTRMLGAVASYVKERGFHEIRLEVDKQNKRALQSYQCNGFDIMPSHNYL